MNAQTIYAKPLKSGKWRLYEIEERALMHWRGPNAIARVLHDLDGSIVNFNSLDEVEKWARSQHLDAYDGEWPKCQRCGHYYRLAEDAHMNAQHCEQQARIVARRNR